MCRVSDNPEGEYAFITRLFIVKVLHCEPERQMQFLLDAHFRLELQKVARHVHSCSTSFLVLVLQLDMLGWGRLMRDYLPSFTSS